MCLNIIKEHFTKDLMKENINLKAEIISLKERIKQLEQEAQTYVKELEDITAKLTSCETSLSYLITKPKLHDELYETDRVYRGNRVFYTKDQTYKYTLPKIQDYFKCSEEMIKKEIQKAGITPDMTMLDKFRKASYYVAQNYTYMFDAHKFGVEENWEPIENLIVTKRGDCETMSMLVVMMCRVSGIPSNKVFMADGLYVTPESEFGHAFPVLWAEDGKWYVGEPTNRRFTVQTWEKLRFKYVCLWGMGNDQYSVKIKGDKTFL